MPTRNTWRRDIPLPCRKVKDSREWREPPVGKLAAPAKAVELVAVAARVVVPAAVVARVVELVAVAAQAVVPAAVAARAVVPAAVVARAADEKVQISEGAVIFHAIT